ncbi:MAG: 30S ribosomal protein S8 [Candidatus Aenigmarchaeota archaeon]|nr:30S ribosomal protein S8 [Candidatus Aenigmarchaeota archaeon]
MAQDLLNEALTVIRNAERAGKTECTTPASELIKDVLLVMQKNGYIGNFERMDDKKSGRFKIELMMKINDCGAISPRFSISLKKMEKKEIVYLPAKDFGILVLSTSKGVMDQKEAKSKKIGGKLISFVY